MKNQAQKKEESNRRKRWNKAEKPYYTACLTCKLSCAQTIAYGETIFDMHNCPKPIKGSIAFPYKFEEETRMRKGQQKRQDNGQGQEE